ncbi:MAG: hypothetical protein ACXAEU_06680 [Candidatus Hodarchaeales archaeon]
MSENDLEKKEDLSGRKKRKEIPKKIKKEIPNREKLWNHKKT